MIASIIKYGTNNIRACNRIDKDNNQESSSKQLNSSNNHTGYTIIKPSKDRHITTVNNTIPEYLNRLNRFVFSTFRVFRRTFSFIYSGVL